MLATYVLLRSWQETLWGVKSKKKRQDETHCAGQHYRFVNIAEMIRGSGGIGEKVKTIITTTVEHRHTGVALVQVTSSLTPPDTIGASPGYAITYKRSRSTQMSK